MDLPSRRSVDHRYLDALTSGIYPANETKDPTAPVCVGGPVPSPASMLPAIPPCGPNEAPSLGHNCLCSRVSRSCPEVHSGVYVATTEQWPDGPWRVTPVEISGPGWSPYNSTLFSIGTSNPTGTLLQDKRTLLSFRSHRGYWPEIEKKVAEANWGSGEHVGFALGTSIGGQFTVSGNLSWQYGNDEDPFVWQQSDGSLHCLYHNGRSDHTNHGLHAFSTDGVVWHKPYDALLPACATDSRARPAPPSLHNCSALYTDLVELDNGHSIVLVGRERPALLFDANGVPTYLVNGAIPANTSVPWYAMAQPIRSA